MDILKTILSIICFQNNNNLDEKSQLIKNRQSAFVEKQYINFDNTNNSIDNVINFTEELNMDKTNEVTFSPKFEELLTNLLTKAQLDTPEIKNVLKDFKSLFNEFEVNHLLQKLNLFYEYEKKYLELIKEHKEEIKFINSMQEDLRKEKTKFFAQDLKEVSGTLKNAELENNITSRWIQELVNSYTKSVDLSSELVQSQSIEMAAKLKNESEKIKTNTVQE